MPRLTPERREARRAEILAAARRCFSRDGFHQTSMPDIADEAGLSAGAAYRYFSSKEDIIIEIAGQAFAAMFAPLDAQLVAGRAPDGRRPGRRCNRARQRRDYPRRRGSTRSGG